MPYGTVATARRTSYATAHAVVRAHGLLAGCRHSRLDQTIDTRYGREIHMTTTVGDFLVDRLHQWGVRRMFGYPGDGINGVFSALNRAKDKIEFVQARHEEMAAF